MEDIFPLQEGVDSTKVVLGVFVGVSKGQVGCEIEMTLFGFGGFWLSSAEFSEGPVGG